MEPEFTRNQLVVFKSVSQVIVSTFKIRDPDDNTVKLIEMVNKILENHSNGYERDTKGIILRLGLTN